MNKWDIQCSNLKLLYILYNVSINGTKLLGLILKKVIKLTINTLSIDQRGGANHVDPDNQHIIVHTKSYMKLVSAFSLSYWVYMIKCDL